MAKTLGTAPSRVFGLAINEVARPAGRALAVPTRPHPVAGGR